MADNLNLVLIREIGMVGDIHEYEFFFSSDPDNFWGEGFDCNVASQEEIVPDEKKYDKILKLKTAVPFFCMQKTNCFSMRHVIDKVVCVAFEDITDYDVYPEPYRIVFKFGEDIGSVKEKLGGRELYFENY